MELTKEIRKLPASEATQFPYKDDDIDEEYYDDMDSLII